MTVEQCETCEYNNEQCKITTIQMYNQIKTNMLCGDYRKQATMKTTGEL